MAEIKVHVLNFHGLTSHIEIVLEDISADPHNYLFINRWSDPDWCWSMYSNTYYTNKIASADARFSFILHGTNQNKILSDWSKYYNKTSQNASVLGDNCAVAAQWFLKTFAGVEDPSMSNISFNHLALGVVWPSLIPCPITLPGRIMSNLKFHIASDTKCRPNEVESENLTSRYIKVLKCIVSAILTIILLPITFLFVTCFYAAKLMNNLFSGLTAFKPDDAKNDTRSYSSPHAP